MQLRNFIVLAALTLAACKSRGPEAKLADNDVVTFVSANRGHEVVVQKGPLTARIRLIGIYSFDARVREKNEVTRLADEAISHWGNTYKGKQLKVMLGPKDTDPRGRFIGYLYDGDADLGESLIREGQAALYTEYPFKEHDAYVNAEAEARGAKRGIWGATEGVAHDRLRALRDTWTSLHRRKTDSAPNDPWLKGAK